MRKQGGDNLSVPIRHLPENLSKMRLLCPSCSRSFSPAWFEKQQFPLKPVKPRKYNEAPYTGPGRWILTQISQKCPFCGALVFLNVPVKKLKTKGSLFGDEAQRDYHNKIVFVYSLIGADQHFIPDLEEEVRILKRNIFPNMSPEAWRLHMKELWSGDHRKKHHLFRRLTFRDVINISNDICRLIKNQENLFVYNIALCADKTGDRPHSVFERLKNEAFILLVLYVIDEWTSKNAQPYIYFDSQKKSQAKEVIHRWAKEAFRGSQHCLLYAFIAKGIEIPEPKFVAPASYPALELADFVSYVIARYYFRKWQGRDVEIDPKSMGLVTYLGYDTQGNLVIRRQEGYPWDLLCN